MRWKKGEGARRASKKLMKSRRRIEVGKGKKVEDGSGRNKLEEL